MKAISLKSTSFIFLFLFLFSCSKEEDIEPEDDTIEETINESENNVTFGIRHDKTLLDYEKIATNTSPYNTLDYPDFSSVLNFSYSLDGSSDHQFVATGVLVAPNWILTAGHNFFVSETQTSPAMIAGISVNVGNDPQNPSQTLSVSELIFHPTWLINDQLFTTANDLCLVKLSTSITTITPAPIYEQSNEPLNNKVWYAGFGDYSTQPGQSPEAFSKKHALENTLDRIVSGIVTTDQSDKTYNGGLLAFDFDSPNGNTNTLGDTYSSLDEPLLGTGSSNESALDFEGTTVEGDSGGPLFCKIDNEWKVVGILSGGADSPVENHIDSNYGDISIFIRVSNNISWINSIIQF